MGYQFLAFKSRWSIQRLLKGMSLCSLLTKNPRSHFGYLDHFGWEPESLLDSAQAVPVQRLSFKMKVHIPTEVWPGLCLSDSMGVDGLLLSRTMTVKDVGISRVSVLRFIALYRCCVLLQTEGRTLHQQKLTLLQSSLYCGGLELNPKYACSSKRINLNAICKMDWKVETGLSETN